MQDGPKNYLRDPFPAENWVGNGIANTADDVVSIIVDLDEVAKAAWDLGNHCLPLSERLWAGTKIVGITAVNAFGGAIFGKALKGLSVAVKHFRVTRRLQAHVRRAANEVDSLGDAAFTRRQLAAMERNPNLEPAFRGNRIDVRARKYAEKDPYLSHLQSNYNRGPDFVDPATGRWWDMTTPGQWQKHVNKYGTGGTHLPTR